MPLQANNSARTFDDTEEFIEQKFPVDIQYTIAIDRTVTQKGWRPAILREMLRSTSLLLANKELDSALTDCDVLGPYEVRWKVLNRGDEAERLNKVRGQIVTSNSTTGRHERTEFRGDHLVECYVVKEGVVVARDRINVPLRTTPAMSAQRSSLIS